MATIIIGIILFVLFFLSYYLFLPAISLGFFGSAFFILLWICISVFAIGFAVYEYFDEERVIHIGIIIAIISVVILGLGSLFSSAIFHSSEKYHQIGEMQQRSFKDDILEIDTSQIPTVDIELAKKVADKKLGEETALGSQVEIGEFTNKQQVNGKLVYVAPLEHRGFFKWYENQWGTPGYVVVSATNPNDVKLVRNVEEKDLKLKYINSGWFGDNLKRHIRESGFRSEGLTEFSFELDDTGYPYWVVSTYKNTTLWGTPEATGVVICDPQTGECKWYSVDEAPEWVDIIQPEEFIVSQLSNYGNYVHGWWNPSEKDELTVTPHITTVYNEGSCYYYTGMSSSGADEGTVGFVLVNTRDKSVIYYKMAGATEAAAMRSAEGKVQDMGYTATEPIPLNISGIPAYFCTFKDSEGLIKGYAMLKIEDYSIVATGNSVMEVKRAFVNAVNMSGTRVDFGSGDNVFGYSLEGKVTRIGANIENGETYYYIILNDDKTKLYLASYTISEELPITRDGDTVKVSYIDESNGTINIVAFDNVEFSQTISEKQEEINKQQDQNNIINSEKTTVTEVKPEEQEKKWENLSDEEKAKLLEKIE